jgi:hypothetical protein
MDKLTKALDILSLAVPKCRKLCAALDTSLAQLGVKLGTEPEKN